MALLNRFRDAAQKAGNIAIAVGSSAQQQLNESTSQFAGGFTLPKECERAAKSLQTFLADPKDPKSALNSIPKAVLRRARGLAVFTVVKAGFVWSGRVGSGILIARLDDGSWSAPSCIGLAGGGFGFQIGADLSEFVVVLNTDAAVKSFARSGNLTVGAGLQATAGPIGTGGAVEAAIAGNNRTPLFTYSKSKGLYAGVSLEGTALVERKDANAEFYGSKIPAESLLSGVVPPPEIASSLYTIVEAAEAIDESSLPESSFTPDPVSQGPSSPRTERPIFDADRP